MSHDTFICLANIAPESSKNILLQVYLMQLCIQLIKDVRCCNVNTHTYIWLKRHNLQKPRTWFFMLLNLQGDQNCCLGVCHMKTTPFVQKNLAGDLKTPKVTRISAMYVNFSHPPVHSGPICFSKTKNLKLPSGTNNSK